MSIGTFPSSLDRSNSFEPARVKKTDSFTSDLGPHDEVAEREPTVNQENTNILQLPASNRNGIMSPASPGSPFSPAANGSFSYKNEEDEQLVFFPWFAGNMDREKAEEILQRFPNGTFLLRISCKGETYKAISVK